MKFVFDNNIELLYGLSYCVNRENNTIKLYNTKEKNELLDTFYNIYLNNISKEVKEKLLFLGEYHNLAKYALENKYLDFLDVSIFYDFFNQVSDVRNKIINDIKNKQGVNKINLEQLKNFFGFNLTDNVKIYLSIFISGGFGIYCNNTSNIIIGVKYNNEKKEYGVTGTTVCKIYHEFSHPYIDIIINNKNFILKNQYKTTLDCYDSGDKTKETLARTIELIFSYDIFGEEYLNWAINEQEKMGFKEVGKIVKLYQNNKNVINNINEFLKILLDKNILIKGSDSNE